MAGTLTISTLSDGTNSTSSTNCIQGSAKAWANWNSTGTAIYASYNVSSITQPSTGIFTINFANAMPDANYSIVGQSTYGNSMDFFIINGSSGNAVLKTSTQVQVSMRNTAGAVGSGNSNQICCAVFR